LAKNVIFKLFNRERKRENKSD